MKKKQPMIKNRNPELDTLKFLAIFLIYTTHFIANFNPEIFVLWDKYPSKIILSGLTGKLGVAVFGILLGYFGYFSGKKKSLIVYSIKRYGYFVFVGLFINTLCCIWQNMSFSSIIPVSLTVGSEIFPTYWCIRDFLFASIITFYMGISKWKFNDKLIFILLLFVIGLVWVPICIMGTLIPDLIESKCFQNRILNLFWIAMSFISIKRSESVLTYILDAIFALVLVCAIENSTIVKRVLSNNVTSSLGKNTMAIFVIHPIAYCIIGQWLFNGYLNCYGFDFFVAWLICFIIICILSYPLTFCFNLYNIFFEKIINFFEKKIKNNNGS